MLLTITRKDQNIRFHQQHFHFYNYYNPFFIQERKDWQPSLKILGENKKTSWYEYELSEVLRGRIRVGPTFTQTPSQEIVWTLVRKPRTGERAC